MRGVRSFHRTNLEVVCGTNVNLVGILCLIFELLSANFFGRIFEFERKIQFRR